jgi:2-polyprenyl-6-methoxyphenol hydroxylase-like FAD-dependent oxidoreductase
MVSKASAVTRGNVALVGDASCTVDGIAGQGLSLAFLQAIQLAEAFSRGDLGPYAAAHAHIVRTPVRVTRLLLAMNASSMLRRKALRLFAANSGIFAKMISIHTLASSLDTLNTTEMLGLGWHVMWA